MNWLTIILFGYGLSIGLRNLLDRRPQIIINEFGIFDRTMHSEFINWSLIKHAYLVTLYREKHIALVVDKQFRPSKNNEKKQMNKAGYYELLGAEELNIRLGQIKIDENKLLSFILEMSGAENSTRQELLKSRLLVLGKNYTN